MLLIVLNGATVFAVLFLKESVVVLRGVNRRIEINQINRGVCDITLENFEIVAVIQGSHARRD